MYEIVEQYAFVATHQIHGLPDNHPCAGVHSHRWVVELTLAAGRLMPTDGPSEVVVLEPVRVYLETELNGRHLNDLVIGEPTPARVAWHVASWCQDNLAMYVVTALSSVTVSSSPRSRVRYVVPRVPTKGGQVTHQVRGPSSISA